MINRFLFTFLLLCGSIHSDLIEFYSDWSWLCKGNALFTPPTDWKGAEWETLWKIQSRLRENKWDIVCWDYDFYKAHLLKGDCKAWNALPVSERNLTDRFWVFWNMGGMLEKIDLSRVPKEKLALFIWEPPTVQASLYDPKVQAQFGKIFTWDDDLVDNVRFIKFHYPSLKPRLNSIPDFATKKLCVLINSYSKKSTHPKEIYSERVAAARFFEDKPGEFDLYGAAWDELGLKNWKGKAWSKAHVLKNYRFCICYENMRDVRGYITEKIFDCFMAGCVPIYWGASNVCDYIPPECFIDRRKFQTMEELYKYISGMDRKEYEQYLESALKYIESEEAKVFSRDAFVEIFMKHLLP